MSRSGGSGLRHLFGIIVTSDPEALDGPDLAHSADEARYLRLGRAADGRVLMVAYTLRRFQSALACRHQPFEAASAHPSRSARRGLSPMREGLHHFELVGGDQKRIRT